MNKHMKRHSQQLNIKTTRLASLTSVFRPKKQQLPTTDRTSSPAMDVHEEGCLPEQGSQVGSSETAPHEPTLRHDESGTEDDNGSNGNDGSDNDGSEGLWVDSDSEDEFESDEESSSGQAAGSGVHQRILEFDLRAAEAGDIHYET